jgi:hypothetical protein
MATFNIFFSLLPLNQVLRFESFIYLSAEKVEIWLCVYFKINAGTVSQERLLSPEAHTPEHSNLTEKPGRKPWLLTNQSVLRR